MEKDNITFIGAGNMTRALIVGLINTGYSPNKITASNPSIEKLEAFQRQFQIQTTQDNSKAAENADIIVFGVKPKVIPTICGELKEILTRKKPLVISVATGITTPTYESWLDKSLAIVRAMPNTPSAVCAGATGLYANQQTQEHEKNKAEELFRAVGVTTWVEQESHLDLITATSGSGPAYYFLIVEYMQEIATRMGLSEETARLLSLQTILGAAKLAMETQIDVKELRRSITSPNGTTEAAIHTFEAGQLKALVEKAMQAAVQRSKKLAEET